MTQTSNVSRRSLVRGGAAVGASVLMAAPTRAESPLALGCAVPAAPVSIGTEVGLAYIERFSGELAGAPLELELRIEIDRLPEFLNQQHIARISSGFIRQQVASEPMALRSGTVELFRSCGQGDERDLIAHFEYLEPSGRIVSGRGVRRLSDPNERDAAAQLSELSLTLSADGRVIASGVLRSGVEDWLDRLVSVQVLRAEGAVVEAARTAFFEFFNRSCAAVHDRLPPLVATRTGLHPSERRALVLLATVMLPGRLPADGPNIDQAIQQLEIFIANADPEALADLRGQLRMLGQLAPVRDGVIRALRRFALDILESEKPNLLRSILDSIHKVAVLGFYAHPAADSMLGYQRPRFEPLYRTQLPVRAAPTERVFDVAIVGSGVAGSVLAERLSAGGKSVVILEAGPYIPEAELTTDEALWIAKLQKLSGLQRANEAEPQVSRVGSVVLLQGACVGGGGMINNAVNFMLPRRRLEQWLGLGFPIPPAALRASYIETARELHIGPVSTKTRFLNPVCALLQDAFGEPKTPVIGQPPSPGFYECLVNLLPNGCRGCGMCNTGCGSERKRNALQVHLPRALASDRDTELVPNAQVVDIEVEQRGGAHAVVALGVRTALGAVRVRAKEYVLSAGAIHTTALILRSASLRRAIAHLPIGRRFSANVVSPMLSFYDTVLHHRPSLQLTHYYAPAGDDDGFLIENLYNPPGQSALVMPGYGEVHYRRMRRYVNTALTGIAIGTSANGEVRLDSRGRVRTTLPMADNEHRRMRAGFEVLARALLRGGQGIRPTEVIAGALGGGYTMKSERDIAGFARWFETISRVVLSTGHPQGGSAMSLDPRISVVDGEFRLRGVTNLRVCDASLFPMVSGVNPQWTVLAIADYCGRVMNGRV